ncbi:hypothetical protein EJ02DRAFT_129639 [Clathrospora elynae]|uniref:Uncharacterized protein n=1 Tax=Clathrospora elynae TaxID=706981 RepID=A0A6A5SUW2_9PLEO|nr:hypothetical protein EJ02DRAFT_129639 [Clathrospora elynae]
MTKCEEQPRETPCIELNHSFFWRRFRRQYVRIRTVTNVALTKTIGLRWSDTPQSGRLVIRTVNISVASLCPTTRSATILHRRKCDKIDNFRMPRSRRSGTSVTVRPLLVSLVSEYFGVLRFFNKKPGSICRSVAGIILQCGDLNADAHASTKRQHTTSILVLTTNASDYLAFS